MMDYDIRHGRTYMYSRKTPLYVFGHGLSYTTFEYAGLATSSAILPVDGEIAVSVHVTNTGPRNGDEVVQMYVRHPRSQVARPIRELKGFERVSIPAGTTRRVRMTLSGEALGHFDAALERFVVEPGPAVIEVGRSSRDIRLEQAIRVTP
jgi:beta-glucosidase